MRSLPNCGVQVTQNTVDKYLDDILLETVYTVAHEDTLQEMGLSPAQLTVEGEAAAEGEGAARRASAGESQPEKEVRNRKERSAVKQKMKATQRKYLSAAHDQIWGMLDQFKQRGEVRDVKSNNVVTNINPSHIQIVSENVKEIDSTIRGSVNTILDNDQVEVDLKNAVSGLDINWSV